MASDLARRLQAEKDNAVVDMAAYRMRFRNGVIANPRGPSIQIIPTLSPQGCKYCLHWAIWILGVRHIMPQLCGKAFWVLRVSVLF